MMFIDSEDKRYRNFYKQFRKLSNEDKLAAVNYIIFSFSEDVYINKDMNKIILDNESLIVVSRKTVDIISSTPNIDSKIASDSFSFSKMNGIPNLLLESYKVR